MLYGLLAELVDAAASRAVTSSGFESLGAHHFVDEFVFINSVTWCVSKFVELVSRGDVVEMGDTLVLETSAFARESSNLSIPTRRVMETWSSGLWHRTANAECL